MKELLGKMIKEDFEDDVQPRYHFTLTLVGSGDTPEEAWTDAIEGFSMDPGSMPEDFELAEKKLGK